MSIEPTSPFAGHHRVMPVRHERNRTETPIKLLFARQRDDPRPSPRPAAAAVEKVFDDANFLAVTVIR
jgi:hypothetical protein